MEAKKPEGSVSEVDKRCRIISRVLKGNTTDEVPNKKGDSGFSGTVLDGNTDTFVEVVQVGNFLEELLDKSFQEAKVATLVSADGKTKVEVFGVALGTDGNYFLSRWHNDGEKPSYVLWPKDMYDVQLIGNKETEAPFQLTEGEWE